VIAIKQKPDKDDVSDERLFCGDRRQKGRRFESRGERGVGIMLDRIGGWIGTLNSKGEADRLPFSV